MGAGIVLKCKKCRYSLDASFGIGFLYPSTCEDLLQQMKKGDFGKEIMDAANSIPGVAVHQRRALFVCEECGSLRVDNIIDLCVPMKQNTKRKGRFSVAFEFPDAKTYVMDDEIGSLYQVHLSVVQKCEHCQSTMKAIADECIADENLKCPKCKNELAISEHYYWD